MDNFIVDIDLRIPANKFYPPRQENSFLIRRKLLSSLCGKPPRVVYVEAQAGQGKTVLAAQFLEKAGRASAWYQVGPEDRDPVLFLTSLLACLSRALPDFRVPLLQRMLQNGEVAPQEIARCANPLLHELDRLLNEDLFLVFDDIHFLEDSAESLALLKHLLRTAPPHLRFILATRRPLGLESDLLRFGREAKFLYNEDLALNERQTAELFHDVLSIPLADTQVRELHRSTEGWMMGLVLAAHALGSGRKEQPTSIADGSLAYFQAEALSAVPEDLRHPLLRLSIPDEIPVELAGIIAEFPEILESLQKLRRSNHFLRSLDVQDKIFRFHHLFHEFLRNRAQEELHSEDLLRVRRRCAEFYLSRNASEKALPHLLELGDFETIEEILEREGFRYVALNRIGALGAFLKGISENIAFEHPWIAYYSGLALMEKMPPRALPFFERARALFTECRDRKGELLTLAQLILFHCSVDCRYHLGSDLLQRAEELFPAVRDRLDIQSLIIIAMNMSHGFCTVKVEPRKAKRYSALALELTRRQGLLNLEAFTRFNIGIQNAFFGNHVGMLEEIEKALPLFGNPQVNHMNRMLLRVMQLNALALMGDFENFFSQEAEFHRETEGDFVVETVSGPILLVNSIDAAIADDKLSLALERIEKGLSWGGPAQNPHLRSQFLHYKAFVLTLTGAADEACACIARSRRMRMEAGGEIWQIVSDMILGGALVHTNRNQEAEDYLGRAIEHAIRFEECFLRAGAYAHRAFLRLNNGREEEGISDVRECLRCMRENGYSHFFTWTPGEMHLLLTTAVRKGIEMEYARFLAAEKLREAIRDDGTALPLLTISTFGKFSISLGGRQEVAAMDLTPAQRELLGLLLCAPGLELSQEEVQSALWPDSPAGKARSKFDNLVSRLRKVMDDRLGRDSGRDYLVLEKGILRLIHCRVDAREFRRKALKGLRHLKRDQYWQAGNAFFSAIGLWKGIFLREMKEGENLRDCRYDLQELYFAISLEWSRILSRTGRQNEAEQALEKAWRFDRSHDGLAKELYRLARRRKEFRKARAIAGRYESTLLDMEYPPGEIREILREWTAPPSAIP